MTTRNDRALLAAGKAFGKARGHTIAAVDNMLFGERTAKDAVRKAIQPLGPGAMEVARELAVSVIDLAMFHLLAELDDSRSLVLSHKSRGERAVRVRDSWGLGLKSRYGGSDGWGVVHSGRPLSTFDQRREEQLQRAVERGPSEAAKKAAAEILAALGVSETDPAPRTKRRRRRRGSM